METTPAKKHKTIRDLDREFRKLDRPKEKFAIHVTVILATIIVILVIPQFPAASALPLFIQEVADRHFRV